MRTTINQQQYDADKSLRKGTLRVNDLTSAAALLTEVQAVYPSELAYELGSDGKGEPDYVETVRVKLTHQTLDIYVSKSFDGKYRINCYDHAKYKNLSRHSVEQTMQAVTRPNNIGVLSASKILAWVNYYEEVHRRLSSLDVVNSGVIKGFMDKIKDMSDIVWSKDRKNGRVVRNGIQYEFNISEEYVSEKIEVHYSVNDSLTNFLALSDNKYKSLK